MPADRFQFLPDPAELLNGFTPGGKEYVLAARLEGPLKTAFPDGAPTAADREAPVDDALDGRTLASGGQREHRARRRRRHVERSAVGAGAEFPGPAGRDGVRQQRRLRHQRARQSLGQRRPDRPAQPRDLHAAVHDRRRAAPPRRRSSSARPSSGSRPSSPRPSASWASCRARATTRNSLLMSPEQQAEIQRFLDEQIRIRQELRAVRRNLDADINSLGTWLKVINIARGAGAC